MNLTTLDGLIVGFAQLASLSLLLELNLCLMHVSKTASEDDADERPRVPPVRDECIKMNPRAMSGRLRNGKERQSSQNEFLDPSEKDGGEPTVTEIGSSDGGGDLTLAGI